MSACLSIGPDPPAQEVPFRRQMSYIHSVAPAMHFKFCLSTLFFSFAATLFGQWTPIGPDGGSAHVLAVDARNPQLLLAGSRNLLLYRSEDAGQSWHFLNFPVQYEAAFNVVAIDPSSSDTFYIGVSANTARPPAENGAGLYKTTDAGKSWTRLPGLLGISVYCLTFFEQDGRILVAGTNHGVYRSKDSGTSWEHISPSANYELQGVMSIAIDPRNSQVIYAGTPHLPWKTADGGATWHSIHTGMIDDSDVFSLRIDRRAPERVYASACSGIYGSSSSGATWTKLQGIPSTNRRTHVIAQDPKHPSTLYAGTTLGLWKSTDRGVSWRKTMDENINALVLDSNGVMYLAVEQHGLLKSEDGGETFREINHGYVNRTITTMQTAGGPEGPVLYVSTIYDGTWGGLFRSDGRAGWQLLANEEALHGRNLTSFAALTGSTRLVGASFDGFLRSADDGHTWLEIASRKAPDEVAKQPLKGAKVRVATRPPVKTAVRPVAARGLADQVTFPSPKVHINSFRAATGRQSFLIAATSAGLFTSVSGDDWQALRIAPKITLPVSAVFVSPGDTGGIAAITPAGLYLSHDRGKTWLSAFLPYKPEIIGEVAFDSTDPNLVLAATSDGIYQSLDGGRTWLYRRGGMPEGSVDSVVFHPSHHGEAYALHFGWVYQSRDGGKTWKVFDRSGLGNVMFRTIAFSRSGADPRLYGLTTLQGVFAYPLGMQSASQSVTVETHAGLN